MYIIKKVIAIILSASICIIPVTGTSAAGISASGATARLMPGTFAAAIGTSSAPDINKMASALNKLNILQGTNGNYNLGSQTRRCDATAFIVRMLGKENYVKQNAEQFKHTKYTDVASTSWYAPYVGYCTLNNILSGKTSNTFAPIENTTEKQFLKMALCALGYIDGTDFDWSNIYQKAYSIGIVTDSSYASKTQDNTNYLRSEAIKVIYRALNTSKKGTQRKLAYVLVDEGAFLQADIAASGVIFDAQATVIDLITATAPDSIEINLNENIQSINAGNITIYDTAATSNVLTVKSASFSNDKIQVLTSGQLSGRDYTVKISSITDIDGNISGNLTGSFKGYIRKQVTSDLFRISKVEQGSANVLNVYFTQPVNTNVEIPAYYEITKNGATFIAGSSQNLAVKKLQSEQNAVSIYLKNVSLGKDDVFGLKISGKLVSSYGAKLGDGVGESMDFVTTAAQSGQLELNSAQAWSSSSVKLIFSREIDPAWAGRKLNYTVYNANKSTIDVTNAVVSDSGDNSGKEVILSLASSLDKTKQYEVKIEFIPDIYKQSTIEGKTYAFSGIYPETAELALSQAASEYNNCVILIFNKALNATSAGTRTNYIIHGVNDSSINITPEKVYYSEQYGQYIVKLFLPSGKTLSNTQRYIVYVTGLKDSLGTSSTNVLRGEFSGGSNSVVKPQIADAVTVARDIIKLRFNVEIAFDVNNISTTNYSLEYTENGETMKMAPVGVTYVDANTLVLKFDELDQTKSYQIRFNTITDYSGVNPRTASDGGNTAAVRWGK